MEITYRELTEGKWHVMKVPPNLDEDGAKLAKFPSDSGFESLVLSSLWQAIPCQHVRQVTQACYDGSGILRNEDTGSWGVDALSVDTSNVMSPRQVRGLSS
jgi:hypothetical protein